MLCKEEIKNLIDEVSKEFTIIDNINKKAANAIYYLISDDLEEFRKKMKKYNEILKNLH